MGGMGEMGGLSCVLGAPPGCTPRRSRALWAWKMGRLVGVQRAAPEGTGGRVPLTRAPPPRMQHRGFLLLAVLALLALTSAAAKKKGDVRRGGRRRPETGR